LLLLRDVLGELSHSKFLPVALEMRIGTSESIAPYEIELQDGSRILLSGIVDRIDAYTDAQGQLYLRVVDYKSGSKSFSLDEVRKGIDMQLLIYLFALCRASAQWRDAQPAGALYLSLKKEKGVTQPQRSGLLLNDDDILTAMNDLNDPHYLAGIRTDKNDTRSGKALTEADEFASLERDIRATLRAIGTDMRAGRAAKTDDPDNCRFCPLKGHCAGATLPT
jgi:ATP-dependent helicase/nuclease subunit B